jgi:phospholipase/carboxylesterase
LESRVTRVPARGMLATVKSLRAVLGFAAALALVACDRGAPAPPPADPSAAPRGAEGPGEVAGVRFLERLTGGVSAAEAAREPLPMIVAIHGLGDRPESFAEVVAPLGVRARLVVPYGLEAWGGGFSWFAYPPRSEADLARGIERAAHRLGALIEALARARPTRGKAIVTGFSQGGMLSFALAALHPETVGAAFPVGGLLTAELRPERWPMGREQPVVRAFHGAADDRVPVVGARETVSQLRAVGLDASLREYPGVKHTIPIEMRRDLLAAIDAAAR